MSQESVSKILSDNLEAMRKAREEFIKAETCNEGNEDSSRQWYKSLTERLLFLDCKQSTLDKTMFMWYNDGDLANSDLVHIVDDMI